MGKMLAVATAALFVAFGAADAAKAADPYAPQGRPAHQHRYGYDRYGYDRYGYDGWPADRRYAERGYAYSYDRYGYDGWPGGAAIPWAAVGQPSYMTGDYSDYF